MVYHLYTTEGFVLGERTAGEANKIFSILTPEFGVLHVAAQSIRALKSKLRYHVASLAYGRFTVVRGKDIWRLTSAEKSEEFSAIYADPEKIKLLARIFSVLKRYIYGEAESAVLFNDLKAALVFLSAVPPEQVHLLPDFENVLLLRLLRQLGYIKNEPAIAPFLEFTEWTPTILEQASAHRQLAIKLINSSFEQSHMN